MGTKNTIDSATMMNKGLEVIEASRLFGLPGAQVRIVVHPQSIVHGFVLFRDGNVKGQLAAPDMRLPIGYALAYPNRLSSIGGPDDLTGAPPAAARPPSAEPMGSPRVSSIGGSRGQTGAPPAAARPPSAEPMGSPGINAVGVLEALGGKMGQESVRYEFEAPDFERFPCVGLAYQALAEGGTLPAVLSAANEVAVEAFVEGRIAFGDIRRIIGTAMEQTRPGEPSLEGVRRADRSARERAREIVASIERSSC